MRIFRAFAVYLCYFKYPNKNIICFHKSRLLAFSLWMQDRVEHSSLLFVFSVTKCSRVKRFTIITQFKWRTLYCTEVCWQWGCSGHYYIIWKVSFYYHVSKQGSRRSGVDSSSTLHPLTIAINSIPSFLNTTQPAFTILATDIHSASY